MKRNHPGALPPGYRPHDPRSNGRGGMNGNERGFFGGRGRMGRGGPGRNHQPPHHHQPSPHHQHQHPHQHQHQHQHPRDMQGRGPGPMPHGGFRGRGRGRMGGGRHMGRGPMMMNHPHDDRGPPMRGGGGNMGGRNMGGRGGGMRGPPGRGGPQQHRMLENGNRHLPHPQGNWAPRNGVPPPMGSPHGNMPPNMNLARPPTNRSMPGRGPHQHQQHPPQHPPHQHQQHPPQHLPQHPPQQQHHHQHSPPGGFGLAGRPPASPMMLQPPVDRLPPQSMHQNGVSPMAPFARPPHPSMPINSPPPQTGALLPHLQNQMHGSPSHPLTQQYPQTIPLNAVPATGATPTSAYANTPRDQVWTDHLSDEGEKYFYNSVTRESTYITPGSMPQTTMMPAAAQTPTSNSVTTSTQSSATSAQKRSKRNWLEYEDAATGKKYYSDGTSTTWERPADFVGDEEKPEPREPPPKRKKAEAKKEKESIFNNRAEAIAAFKGLLLAKAVPPNIKWNEVVKMCSSDSRWAACELTLTVGDRKQAMAEYQTKRANELRNLERQERARAKEAFGEMLTEILPTIPSFSARTSRFIDIRSFLSKQDRFYAVEDEATRETLFSEFCEEMRKREERRKRNRRRDAQTNFLSFLKEKEEAGTFTFASTWEVFVANLSEADKADPRFATSNILADSDRQLYFADAVTDLQATEDDKQHRIREARRRAEKAQRDAYRDALRKLAVQGKIFPHSQWRHVEEHLSADASYAPVLSQDRDAPIDLFNRFVDDWDHVYRRDRLLLSDIVHDAKQDISVKVSTSYDDFTQNLLKEAAYSSTFYGEVRQILRHSDPVCSAKLYYDELMRRAKEGSGAQAKQQSKSRNVHDDSSEDEGEIIEEEEQAGITKSSSKPASKAEVRSSTMTKAGTKESVPSPAPEAVTRSESAPAPTETTEVSSVQEAGQAQANKHEQQESEQKQDGMKAEVEKSKEESKEEPKAEELRPQTQEDKPAQQKQAGQPE